MMSLSFKRGAWISCALILIDAPAAFAAAAQPSTGFESTQLSLAHALELPAGAVVDLDRTADAPIDLFVNGLCFGQGRLLVTEDGEWAIEVKSLNKPVVRKPALVGGAGVELNP